MKKFILLFFGVTIFLSCSESNGNETLFTTNMVVNTSSKTILDENNATNTYYFDVLNKLNFAVTTDIMVNYSINQVNATDTIKIKLDANQKLEYLFYNEPSKISVYNYTVIAVDRVN